MMHKLSVAELSKGLKNRDFSSVELTQHYLKRIDRSDLNAFITVTEDLALSQAREADSRLTKGDADVLTGIPYSHKDIFCTKGVKTSAGSKILDPFISPYDATLSHKLNMEGMVMLGKTNMDELAMGSSNENSYYGPVKNPWDKKKGSWRLLRRFCSSCSSSFISFRYWNGYWWKYPTAGKPLWYHRTKTNLWKNLKIWHDSLCFKP
jgi:aspartyl-tRNA(Asn)/glutamyl-tRNA(Gln) amidotransferase subunit A